MSLFRQSKKAEARHLHGSGGDNRSRCLTTTKPDGRQSQHDDLICWLAYKEAKHC